QRQVDHAGRGLAALTLRIEVFVALAESGVDGAVEGLAVLGDLIAEGAASADIGIADAVVRIVAEEKITGRQCECRRTERADNWILLIIRWDPSSLLAAVPHRVPAAAAVSSVVDPAGHRSAALLWEEAPAVAPRGPSAWAGA